MMIPKAGTANTANPERSGKNNTLPTDIGKEGVFLILSDIFFFGLLLMP